MKTAILLISVGKYDQFIDQMVESIEKHWKMDYTIYLFTDQLINKKYENLSQVWIPFQSFPYCSMYRYHYFIQNEPYFTEDYLFYVDIDARFVDDIGPEILGNLVGVQHCGFAYKGGGSFETRPESMAYVFPGEGQTYYGGGFQGGKTEDYMKLSKICANRIMTDVHGGIKDAEGNPGPIHHDESMINWYFNCYQKPDKILSPDYHYPENDEYFKLNCWGNQDLYKPKILLLEKNHKEIR